MEIPLHQDAAYWPLSPSHTVSVWLALDGTRVLGRQVVDPGGYGARVTNTLAAGEVSLHSDLLLHGSGANRSDRRRAGLTIRYAAGEVKPLPPWESWFKPAFHCRGRLPDHWPNRMRPDGEHPEKMAKFTGEFDGNPVTKAN
jgi:non-heme Fe2+,alpha-ketoglutarate-dependent halogenase